MNIKLNMEKANNIRDDFFINKHSRNFIAKKYSISKWTVSQITLNYIWKISVEEYADYKNKSLETQANILKDKTCTKCHQNKNIHLFNKYTNKKNKIVFSSWCKMCVSQYKKEYSETNKEKLKEIEQSYYQENKEIIIDRVKQYYKDNKDKKLEYDKERRSKDLDKYRKQNRDYYYNNKEVCIERNALYTNKQYKTNPIFKLRTRISSKIKSALFGVGKSKNGHSVLEFLPYSIKDLKNHIENQFEPWMNWNNWGMYIVAAWKDNDQSTWTWQLDHIVPQSDLPYTSMEDDNFKKCWSLENLRPYSAKLNIMDGVKRVRHGVKNG